jgi:hypothetical protein
MRFDFYKRNLKKYLLNSNKVKKIFKIGIANNIFTQKELYELKTKFTITGAKI